MPTKSAVVIFPGGGYEHLATEKEGYVPARWLSANGVASFVVKYRVGPLNHHPAMLEDGQAAILFVRANASRWNVDPTHVGVMGFSAGGHLASTLGTHFDRATRPDFMILVYPVITMDSAFAHTGSRINLLGDHPSPQLVRSLSNETQVTPDTPPVFIVATADDASVPVRNATAFYDALRAANVPVELHVFEHGKHGFGLAPDDAALGAWTSLAEQWLVRHEWAMSPEKNLTKRP
jgi:acetyl esterase/lipase